MDLKIITGSANRVLAEGICEHLGVLLSQASIGHFSDEETRVKIDENVRGADVFVVQPTSRPANQHVMELAIVIDALRRASATRITAVIPYYGYGRQEKKTTGREPITAKLAANVITAAGASRVLCIDLHAAAIQGFFDLPVDHLTAIPLLADHLSARGLSDLVVVSPDSGGVARANRFRNRTGASDLAILAKFRPEPEVAEVVEMVGDVEGRHTVIIDDIIGTGTTLIEAVDVMLERGARSVTAYAVHPVLAADAMTMIATSALQRVVVTNTIPLPLDRAGSKIEVVDVSGLLADAIGRVHTGQSVSALFPPG